MLDRVHWQKTSALRSKINLIVDLAPEKPGEGRAEIEQALRTLFPGGYSRKDARWFFKHALRAMSAAIIKEGGGLFPFEVALVETSGRPMRTEPSNVVKVRFAREQPAA